MTARPVVPQRKLLRTVTASTALLPLLLIILTACNEHTVTLLGPESPEHRVGTFRIPLEGQHVQPGTEPTDAVGEAVLSFMRANVGLFGGTAYAYRLEFAITAEKIAGVTAAHIHGPATADTTGPILATLFHDSSGTGAVDGELVAGSIPRSYSIEDYNDERLSSEIYVELILDLVRDGLAYVDIHTLSHPSGELRGQ